MFGDVKLTAKLSFKLLVKLANLVKLACLAEAKFLTSGEADFKLLVKVALSGEVSQLG